MNLFKSKHQKLLDEKEKIQALYKRVASINPVSEIDEEVKTTQLATLVNNWVTLAKLLDEYQPNFVKTDSSTFYNMIGGKRRTAGLPEDVPIKVETPAVYAKCGSTHINKLSELTAWEKVLPNLKEKAKIPIAKITRQKKVAVVKDYCKTYNENSQIFEDFILEEPYRRINGRVEFVHKNFSTLPHLNTKLTNIGTKTNVVILLDIPGLHTAEVIALCDKLHTYYYDFLIQDTR